MNMEAIKSLSSKAEYNLVASRMEELRDAPIGSKEAEELKYLTRLIVEFEKSRISSIPFKKVV